MTTRLRRRLEVTVDLTEREPDFEDDKIRMWQYAKDTPPPSREPDETVMDVNFQTEEIYESRSYPVLQHPASALLIAERIAAQGRRLTPREQALLVTCVIEESSIRVLSKRRHDDGRMTYLITMVNGYGRLLVERADLGGEDEFRNSVEGLERDLAMPDLLGEPTVISADEWRRYARERGR